MGAPTATTTNPADFASRLQTYFSRQLLKALTFNLRLGAYGVAKELPANSAASTIRFFRPRRAVRASTTGGNTTGPQKLTEGTPPTNQNSVSIGYVDAALVQRGDISSISDIVRAIDLFDTLETYTKTLGADAALDFDGVCSHAICSAPGVADFDGTANPIPATQKTLNASGTSYERFAGVVNTLNGATDFATLAAAPLSNSKMTRLGHLGCITKLKGTKGNPGAPMINGRYPVLCPPEVLFDMRQDSTWMQTAVFDAARLRSIYQWADFELDGGVFCEHNNPFMENATYGTYDNTGTNPIYSVIYLGEEAFGVPKLSGKQAGSDPRSPSMIILPNPDKSDPLNQQVTLGWKAFYQAVLIWTNNSTDNPRAVQFRCKSTFV